MKLLPELISNNRNWADKVSAEDPNFFPELAKKQVPEFLWIGCGDVPLIVKTVDGLAEKKYRSCSV